MLKNTHGTDCPVTKVAELLSDSWTMRIIHLLLGKPGRFCELERELAGISTRTLTLKLKKLEAEKIVIKTESGYALSPQGKKLRSVIKAMETFGKRAS